MIRRTKIKDENGIGSYSFYDSPDFEFVNPIEHYANSFIAVNVSMMRDIVLLKQFPFPIEIIEKVIFKQAVEDWLSKLKEIEQTPIPEYLIAVLNSKSRKEQEKLLRNSSITPDQLIAFIFKAKKDHCYTFSQYTTEHHQKGLDRNQMPKIVEIKNGVVYKVGPTTLSDGQLKQALDHRKIIVSKFLDKQDEWHCLFLTFDSLKGKETWKDGQPHYHYISDKFGISREMVVSQLKRKKYSLGSLPHIDLIGYRDDK